MSIRTRFAPSPTGYLHIGGARTALFNYLFAKHHNGKFLLRIEDTDTARSTADAKQAILTSLAWLGLEYDEEVVYQSQRADRHREIGEKLIAMNKAYYCFSSQEEIADLRNKALSNKEHFIFSSPWRDRDTEDYPKDLKPVIRLKAPRAGETIVNDLLQGKVVVKNSQLDDMVLIRSDGTPTYMLAVVVDDHDMGITHIIRGDDHLNNASRQQLIYQALEWDIPETVHIPLIHGTDGAKLSKRHGALGVESYMEAGYLPAALKNYLLRLGWSHGDNEIISQEQAIELFDISRLGKSPARLDFAKMRNMNAHYLRSMDNAVLSDMIFKNFKSSLSDKSKTNIKLAIDCIKPRIELTNDLLYQAEIFIDSADIEYDVKAQDLIKEADINIICKLKDAINNIEEFNKDNIQTALKQTAQENDIQFNDMMKYIRAFITGRTSSPGIFEIMEIIGQEISIRRLSYRVG